MPVKAPEKGLVDIAREFLEKVTFQLDAHTSQKGEIIVEGREVSLLTPAHIQYAIYGRGPGKKPPLDPILDWIKGESIQFGGMDKEGTAFAIQAAIGKNGTRHWVPNAPNALEEAINENFDEYNKQLAQSLSVVIQDQTADIYKQILPDPNFVF